MITQQVQQRVTEIVGADRSNQDDLLAGAGCQQRGKACAAWPTPLACDVDHRHGCLGTQPAGLPLNIDVQHRVAEDNQRTTAGTATQTSPRHCPPACGVLSSRALSSAMHSACIKLKWIS